MTKRFEQLQTWLNALEPFGNHAFSLPVSASNDASFRRYYRCNLIAETEAYPQGQTFIIMDAPPEHEDCRPFIRVSRDLDRLGLTVTKVIAQDLKQGFLLLTDLGSDTYASQLSEETVDDLYRDALMALVKLQQSGGFYAADLPLYDRNLLTTEMALFHDWLGETHLDISMNKLETSAWQELQEALVKSALQQPQVYVHRDYHSRNLMVLPESYTGTNPGILDFQDAVKGALTYDAVSLLRDCYVRWPVEQVKEWQREYFLMLVSAKMLSKDEWAGFVKAMDLMGIQRHLKASGIFARLFHRDGKGGYLNDIPNTLNYIVEVGQEYPEMRFIVDWVERRLLPSLIQVNKES